MVAPSVNDTVRKWHNLYTEVRFWNFYSTSAVAVIPIYRIIPILTRGLYFVQLTF